MNKKIKTFQVSDVELACFQRAMQDLTAPPTMASLLAMSVRDIHSALRKDSEHVMSLIKSFIGGIKEPHGGGKEKMVQSESGVVSEGGRRMGH